jgi:hypothetical protein
MGVEPPVRTSVRKVIAAEKFEIHRRLWKNGRLSQIGESSIFFWPTLGIYYWPSAVYYCAAAVIEKPAAGRTE